MRLRFLLCATLTLVACRSRPDAPQPAPSAAVAEAPAPASLLAELSIGNPKETWQRARGLGGSYVSALPASLQVLLATSLSLPPAAAGNVDESVPMVGALLAAKGSAEPQFVAGVHVLSGSELLAALTLGERAKFRRLELGPRLVRLVSAPGAPELNGALGVSGNYLLLASSPAALEEAGRYVAEGVIKRAGTEPGLSVRASQGELPRLLASRLREAWQARRLTLAARDRATRDAKGRAPDFGDPQVLLAGADNTVESWLDVLQSSRQLALRVVPERERLRVELELTPGEDGAAALLSRELVVGSTEPLLSLPTSTAAALLLRGEARAAGDGGTGQMVAQLFGERLDSGQRERLVAALDGFVKSRQGATVVGVVPAPVPALLVTCEVVDAEAFNRGIADVLKLLELPPVRGMLTEALGKPSLQLGASGSATRRAVVRFRPERAAKASALPRALGLTWEVRAGVGYVVLSSDEGLGLAPFRETTTLRGLPWFASGNLGLPGQTALAVLLDARLLAPGGADDSRLLLSFGKSSGRVALALDVGAGALPALARLFALDRSP